MARLSSSASGVVDHKVLRPPLPLRLQRLAAGVLLTGLGVTASLGYLDFSESVWWARATGAFALALGVSLLLQSARSRVLLTAEGVSIRTFFREQTIPWAKVHKIDQFSERDDATGRQYGLTLTTTRGKSVPLPGFSTGGFPHTQLPPSLLAAANEIEEWRCRHNQSSPRRSDRRPDGQAEGS